MNDQNISRLLRHDFSKGTEAFRENLLQRCLSELNSADQGTVIDDDDLEMLSAAGVPNQFFDMQDPQDL